jgi:ribose transport system substrate-binding protein
MGWVGAVAAVVLLAALVAGCGGSSDSSSSATEEAPSAEGATANASSETQADAGSSSKPGGPGTTLAYISPVASSEGQHQLIEAIERAAKEAGWSVNVLDSQSSPDKQVSNVELAINKGYDAIASWSLDPNAVAGAYEAAQAKGIPVIGLNSKSPGGLTTTIWYEHQLCEPGGPEAITAEKMAEIHPHAKTLMIGDEVAESTKELSDCFAKEAKRVGLEILGTGNNEGGTTSTGQTVFEPLFTKFPEVEAVWCFNDESAIGVSNVLTAGGKQIATTEEPEGIVVTGTNGEPTGIEAVEENRISWTWEHDSAAAGFATVKLAQEALEGKHPKETTIPSLFIGDETIGEYVEPAKRPYSLDSFPVKQ